MKKLALLLMFSVGLQAMDRTVVLGVVVDDRDVNLERKIEGLRFKLMRLELDCAMLRVQTMKLGIADKPDDASSTCDRCRIVFQGLFLASAVVVGVSKFVIDMRKARQIA